MKIYLAGPMRGYEEFNFPAFHAAAAKLRTQGHEVFSPAEKGFNLREALGVDLAWICAHADAIGCLPGWRNSKGATAERAVGVALGLNVFDI